MLESVRYLNCSITLPLLACRLSLWGLFWLVKKLLKVDISLQGWRPRGFESLSVKTSNLELVRQPTLICI